MLSTAVPTAKLSTTVPTAVPVAMPGVRPDGADRSDAPEALSIDCADCRHQHTSVCDDCIVTFIVGTRARRMPSWSTPTRPGPSDSSSRPAWSPASATPDASAEPGPVAPGRGAAILRATMGHASRPRTRSHVDGPGRGDRPRCRPGRGRGVLGVGRGGHHPRRRVRTDPPQTSGRERSGGSTVTCSSPTGIPTALPIRPASCLGPGPWWSGAWSYRRQPAAPRPVLARAPTGEVAMYARSDHYASLRGALARIAATSRPRVACRRGLRRQRPGRSGRGPPGRPGLVRQEHPPAPARNGLVVRAGIGGHRRAAPPHRQGPRSAPRTRVWSLHPVHPGLPTGALVAPGVSRCRRCLGLAAQAKGSLPPRAPPGLGPVLRVRRPNGPAPSTRWPSGGTRPRWASGRSKPSTSWPCSRPTTTSSWRPTGAGTCPIGTHATCEEMPWWPWATAG